MARRGSCDGHWPSDKQRPRHARHDAARLPGQSNGSGGHVSPDDTASRFIVTAVAARPAGGSCIWANL